MVKTNRNSSKMSLIDHLIELRNRLLVASAAFLVLFFLCFIKFNENNQNIADIVYMLFSRGKGCVF